MRLSGRAVACVCVCDEDRVTMGVCAVAQAADGFSLPALCETNEREREREEKRREEGVGWHADRLRAVGAR